MQITLRYSSVIFSLFLLRSFIVILIFVTHRLTVYYSFSIGILDDVSSETCLVNISYE